MTGKWPGPVWGSAEFPLVLDICPFCEARCITVLHPILVCPHFAGAYDGLSKAWGLPNRFDQENAILALFGRTSDFDLLTDVIQFVGTAVEPFVAVPQLPDEDFAAGPVEMDRIDALLRQADRDFGSGCATLDGRWDDIATL